MVSNPGVFAKLIVSGENAKVACSCDTMKMMINYLLTLNSTIVI